MTCRRCRKGIPDGSAYCNHCGCKQEIATRATKSRGNGQGSAYKRGKSWTAKWTVGKYIGADGKVHYIRKTHGGFKTKRDALIYAASPPTHSSGQAPTLRTYYDTWSTRGAEKLGESRQVAYKIAWRRLAPLCDIPVPDITIGMLQAQIDSEVSTYYPARDMKTVLSHLFKYAMAEGRVQTNLSDFLVLPDKNEKEGVPFTGDEVEAMWDAFAAGDSFVGYMLLMVYTGMMPGELFKLKKEMIDYENCEIVGIGIKTKKRREAIMAFPEFISPVLEGLCERSQSKVGNVLCMNKDKFYDLYHETTRRIGIRDLPPYSCRHTTATALANMETAPYVIQEIMRHTQFSSTKRYIHQDTTAKHAALNKMDAPNQ